MFLSFRTETDTDPNEVATLCRRAGLILPVDDPGRMERAHTVDASLRNGQTRYQTTEEGVLTAQFSAL
jgi:hypothetical protein